MNRFRLERLLEHRRRLSDVAKQELATSTRAYRAAEDEQRRLADAAATMHDEISQSLAEGPIKASELQQMHDLAVQTGHAVQRAVSVVQTMMQREAQALTRARDAAQAHKSLENARSRFIEANRIGESQRALKEADELSGARAARALLSGRSRAEE